MNTDRKFVVRCRAIILHEGQLLLVRHTHDPSFAALPGGHLENGEGVKECMRREVIEELGIEPEIGRLLYVNTFMDTNGVQPVEFFFEIANGGAYQGCEELARSHAHELAEIVWASPSDEIRILPEQLGEDFKTGQLISDEVRFMMG